MEGITASQIALIVVLLQWFFVKPWDKEFLVRQIVQNGYWVTMIFLLIGKLFISTITYWVFKVLFTWWGF